MDDLISRKLALNGKISKQRANGVEILSDKVVPIEYLKRLSSAMPERLIDDDLETIRIHLNAYKEKLCNQNRWEEAEEYQRIIDRFISFALACPEPLTDKEQRIFLSAMAREEKVCKDVDSELGDCREPYEDTLVNVCHEITRKVKGALWSL